MKVSLNARTIVAALTVAGLLLLPLYTSLSGNVFLLTLFTRIVIFALAAVSLNLIMGYGGMMSFGHAAYLGIGGYAVGILAFEGIGSGFIQWPVALLASALATWPPIAPAVKSGPARPAAIDQASDGAVRKLLNAALTEPSEPVNDNCG